MGCPPMGGLGTEVLLFVAEALHVVACSGVGHPPTYRGRRSDSLAFRIWDAWTPCLHWCSGSPSVRSQGTCAWVQPGRGARTAAGSGQAGAWDPRIGAPIDDNRPGEPHEATRKHAISDRMGNVPTASATEFSEVVIRGSPRCRFCTTQQSVQHNQLDMRSSTSQSVIDDRA